MKKRKQGEYSEVNMPEPDGRANLHRPRRNYWGNLKEEDIFREEQPEQSFYDYSDFDSEDDNDTFYNNCAYD